MSDEKELKLACLHQAGGNLDHAKMLYAWVSGKDAPSPDADFESGFYCGLKDSPTAPGSPSGMRGWKEGDALRKRFKEMEARLRTRGDEAEGVHDRAAPTTVSDSGEGEPILQDKEKDEEAGEVAKLQADFAGLDMLEDPADGLLHDKPLIVDDTPTIPRSEIPQGAAVETFTDAGVETVKLSGITHIVDDEPQRVAETQPEAAYAPIHNEDEPATSEQLEAEGITEPGASELAAMRMVPAPKKFGGIFSFGAKKTMAEEGV